MYIPVIMQKGTELCERLFSRRKKYALASGKMALVYL